MSLGAVAILVTLVTAGVFAMLGLIHASQRTISLEEYMVSRNRFGSWMSFATIVAAGLGVWILFSPPQVGASTGIAGIIGYCIGSATPPALFTQIGPRMRQLMPNGHSLNEFVFHRFGNTMYLVTLVVIVFYMFIYLAAELTAIAKAVQILADVPLGWTALIVTAGTFIYTIYGGLSAAIFTDAVQFLVMVPLLLASVAVTVMALGGLAAALEPVRLNAPEILSFSNMSGIQLGATLIIAVIAAEVFNQTNWQRVYACRTDKTVKQAFLGSSLVILPMLFLAGSLGILARHFGFDDDRAFFSLLQQLALPSWVVILVLVLALALVMSTLAALLNGISSVFTMDLIRLFPQMQTRGLLRASRTIIVMIGIPAIAIAAQGFDVLYLFLLADLICAGAVFPILFGMYSRQISGTIAVSSTIVGIGVGTVFFPNPQFQPWNALPFAGNLLFSFAIAVVVSTMIALSWTAIATLTGKGDRFDFSQLKERAYTYEKNQGNQVPHLAE